MDKLYITKSSLIKVLEQYKADKDNYPKPILNILAVLLTIIMLVIVSLLVLAAVIIYALLFWVDILLGKYVIKRIIRNE